jgi:hypothetical protein
LNKMRNQTVWQSYFPRNHEHAFSYQTSKQEKLEPYKILVRIVKVCKETSLMSSWIIDGLCMKSRETEGPKLKSPRRIRSLFAKFSVLRGSNYRTDEKRGRRKLLYKNSRNVTDNDDDDDNKIFFEILKVMQRPRKKREHRMQLHRIIRTVFSALSRYVIRYNPKNCATQQGASLWTIGNRKASEQA